MKVSLKGAVAWNHAFGDVEPTSTLAFVSGSSPFTITGTAQDQDVALVDAGLDFGVTDTLNITADYTGSFVERQQDHTFAAKLRARF